MPLDYNHQVSILMDILSNHQTDCCGTVSECEQLERIIKSLLVNPSIDQNVKDILSSIYSYSQTGKYVNNLGNHIHDHQEQLSIWIDNINQYM